MKSIDTKVDLEYGEGWGWKRVVSVAVLAAGIVGGATFGAMQDYRPAVKTEKRTEYREIERKYEPSTSYVSKE